MNTNSPMSFLELPRELRDEIYQLVLLHGFNPRRYGQRGHERTRGRRLSSPPNFSSLSILRLNKQIHDEASWVFYTQMVFPIRIVAKWSDREFDNCDVEYTAPWEVIHYQYRKGRYYYTPSIRRYISYMSSGFNLCAPRETCPRGRRFPSPEYSHLIRKIQINLDVQFSFYDQLKFFPDSPVQQGPRPDCTKILLFACQRLEDSLDGPLRQYIPGGEINVTVRGDGDAICLQGLQTHEGGFATKDLQRARNCAFREVIQTTYPLMNCLWKPEVNWVTRIETDSPNLVEEVIEECTREWRGREDWRRRILVLPSPKFGKIYWVVISGRLMLA
ncbi:hypothetical protein TWF970_000626 [Orbilia oligospora]|nr:hypothetical protein TWF970_000626 [Orbilia oligospora]